MKRISIKITALFAVLLLAGGAAPVYSGGKSDAPGKGKTITIQVWGGVPAESGPQASVDEFNALYKDKGIQAEYTRFVNDNNGNLQLETNLLSGDSVDVYVTYSYTNLIKRVDSGMTADLSPLISRDSFDIKGFGDFAEYNRINGKYYAIPTKVDYYGIMINKNMFDAAGIPVPTKWTLSEFRAIAKRLTKGDGPDKVYGMFFNTQQDIAGPTGYFAGQCREADWMYASPDGKTAAVSPVTRDTAQVIYEMMNVDKSAPTHVDSVTQKLTQEAMFLTGRSAMSIGPWIVRSVKDLANYPHDFVTAFVPYPVPDNYQVKWSQGAAGDLLSINPKSKNIEAAWEYIKWYSTKGMLPLTRGGRVPLYAGYNIQDVTNAFMTGGEKLLDPATTASVLIAPRSNFSIQTITYKNPELSTIFQEELEAIYNGVKTADQGMKDFKTRSDRILAQ